MAAELDFGAGFNVESSGPNAVQITIDVEELAELGVGVGDGAAHPDLDTHEALGLATDTDVAAHNLDTSSVHGITDTSALATTTNVSDAVAAHAADTSSVHGIADTTTLATTTNVTDAVTTHSADTTSVHGITDTSALATTTNVSDAVTAHSSDTTSVHGITDTTVLATSTTVSDAVTVHNADTTAVHGITDTSALATTTNVTDAVAAHSSDSTAVHGITDTGLLETTAGSQAKVDAHTADTVDAHDASAVSFVPASTISATDVQAAIPEALTDAKSYADDGHLIPTSQRGANDGVAALDSSGKVPAAQIPAIVFGQVFEVASEAAMLALSGASVGDVAIRSDTSESFILGATPASTLSNWHELLSPAGGVTSVNGRTGGVTGVQDTSEKGAVSGYASLDGSGFVPDAQILSTITRDSELPAAVAANHPNLSAHDGLGLATDSELTAHAADTTAIHGITDTSVLETTTGSQGKVDTHSADTTAVHGITNTAALETTTGSQAKVDLHSVDTTAVHGITDTSLLETATGAQAKVDLHSADTTAVHGITNTAVLETTTGSQAKVDLHTADTSAAHAASAVSVNSATLVGVGTDVQAVLEEMDDAIAAGGAPTAADYLVGTAQGGLSAEIVVGTSPGGELGGTWGSPTIDATHSGSSHASVQAAAEATAASGLSTHLVDTVDAHDASAVSVDSTNLVGVSTTVQGVLEELDDAIASHDANSHTDITRKFYLPATVLIPDVATEVNTGTLPNLLRAILMANTATQGAHASFIMPADAKAATAFSYQPVWSGSTTVAASAVRWQFTSKITAAGVDVTAAGTTALWTTVSGTITANILVIEPVKTGLVVNASDLVMFEVLRIGADAADTYTGGVRLHGLIVSYTATQ